MRNEQRLFLPAAIGAPPPEIVLRQTTQVQGRVDDVVALRKRAGDWQKHTGDTSPSGIDPQKEPVDRLARYNKAVADADGESTTSAISKSRRKPADDATESVSHDAGDEA